MIHITYITHNKLDYIINITHHTRSTGGVTTIGTRTVAGIYIF